MIIEFQTKRRWLKSAIATASELPPVTRQGRERIRVAPIASDTKTPNAIIDSQTPLQARAAG
ncbi:MAG: hypothetical protein HC844_01555 [Tabrizicola sp.]|nr:hypothetical protein [Tabrizicola sp.]